jgi:DNA-binding MarR family transcriptional regulator
MADHAEKSEIKEGGRYAYDGIDRVIHEKARLSIVASLASHTAGLLFGDLKDLCTLTDGNLSRHLAVLQDAGLVEVKKSFKNNRPQTWCKLTPAGKKRFSDYVAQLEHVVSDALKKQSPRAAPHGLLPT